MYFSGGFRTKADICYIPHKDGEEGKNKNKIKKISSSMENSVFCVEVCEKQNI